MLPGHLCVPFGEMSSQVVHSTQGEGALLPNWSTSLHKVHISYQIKELQIFSHSSNFLFISLLVVILTKIMFFYVPEFVVLG